MSTVEKAVLTLEAVLYHSSAALRHISATALLNATPELWKRSFRLLQDNQLQPKPNDLGSKSRAQVGR